MSFAALCRSLVPCLSGGLLLALAPPAAAQTPAPGRSAQQTTACTGCVGILYVNPVPLSLTFAAGARDTVIAFAIENQYSFDVEVWNPVCTRTGVVSACGTISPTSLILPAGQIGYMQVRYSTSSAIGTGTLTLRVTHDGTSPSSNRSGVLSVTTVSRPKPGVALGNRPGQAERELCLTTGAGPAVLQCGDLLLAHAMPAFRSLGRDRNLTLVYSSATAAPRPTVAVQVTQPAGGVAPQSVYAELRSAPQGQAQAIVASGTFQAWGGGPTAQTRQIVLGFNAGGRTGGVWDYTLLVRNQYDTGIVDSTLTGTMLVLEDTASAFGRGWSLAGLERIVLAGPNMLWRAAGGAGRLYTPVPGQTTVWVAPKAAFRDTIAWTGTYYERRLRHGVRVQYDPCGQQVSTITRTGQATTFFWSGCGGTLDSISVPPAGGTKYRLIYANGRLQSITDPAGRVLNATINAQRQLTRLQDPDTVSTLFDYDADSLGGRLKSHTGRTRVATTFEYAAGLRVTKVRTPYGTLGAVQYGETTIAPWDQLGLALGMVRTVLVAMDTASVYTRIDGPRLPSDTIDVALIRVDPLGFGAPARITDARGNVTTIVRGDTTLPALVTKVEYPTQQRDSLVWNARANLVQSRSTFPDLPARVRTWAYQDANAIDSPSADTLPLGRVTTYAYGTYGLPVSTTDPRGLVTNYTYNALGLLASVTQVAVPVWRDSDSTIQSLSLTDSLLYDGKGNPVRWRRANGTSISYENDAAGRTWKQYDALGVPTKVTYDAMNRVTAFAQGSVVESHPGGIDPRAGCDAAYFVCADNALASDLAGADANGYFTTNFRFGPATLDSVLDPRGVKRAYTYDASGSQRGEGDEFGAWQWAIRNGAGLIDSMVSRDGIVVKQSYNVDGAPTRIIVPARGNQHPNDATVVPADTIRYDYDSFGRQVRARNRYSDIVRTYYSDGALKTQQVTGFGVGSVDQTTVSYDAAGAVSRVIYNAKDTVRYTYSAATGDLDSVIVRLKQGSAFDTRGFKFVWDKLGRRSQVSYPENGITVNFAYDQLGGMRQLRSTSSNATTGDLLKFVVRNREVSVTGQVLRQTVGCASMDAELSPCGTGPRATVNRYNRRNMLAWQELNSARDSTAYDASGNMVHRRAFNGISWETRTYSLLTGSGGQPSNRLGTDAVSSRSGFVRHFYTASGDRRFEQPADTTNQAEYDRYRWYYYDGLGRMSGSRYLAYYGDWFEHVGATDCRYDADGNMTKPCENNAPEILYEGTQVALTISGWRFIRGPGVDDPLMAVMRNALDQWQLQSPIYFVTDGSGRQWVAATNIGTMPDDYRPGAGTDKSHWRYAGGTARAEGFGASRFAGTSPYTSGLAFFRNRTYDQRTGRWTQEDPLGVAGGLNLYQFNGNNPVSYTDPFGLCPPIDDCLQKLANWGAQRGGAVGTAVLNTAAGLNAVNDVNPVSAAFDAGYDIGSGHVVRGLAMAAFTVGGGAAGRGLTRASSGLRALFAEGGGLADESIIGIRATLRENGFIMKLSENKKGYLFTNGTGEEVRVMPGANGWYMRVKNAFNNYLDAVANPASDATTHLPITNR